MKRPTIIAEVKTASPFGFRSDKTWEELFRIAEEAGDIISIHTDPRWEGSYDLVKRAKGLTDKLILAKGIHSDDKEISAAFDAGADFVLVVGRIPTEYIEMHPQLGEKLLLEPFNLEQLKDIPHHMGVVWNSRDLDTGGYKTETFAEARKLFPGWMCQASNIKTVGDIQEGADAVLVGQNIEQFSKSLKQDMI